MTHTVYIIDDNLHVREALVMLIEDEPDLVICGAAAAAAEALEAIPRLHPDLVLTDYSLDGMSGIELIERLRILKPEQRVAMLSAHTEASYADQALEAGALGYILKGDGQSLIEGLRRVLDGDVYVSAALRMRHRSPSTITE